jgi:hypothetical protein
VSPYSDPSGKIHEFFREKLGRALGITLTAIERNLETRRDAGVAAGDGHGRFSIRNQDCLLSLNPHQHWRLCGHLRLIVAPNLSRNWMELALLRPDLGREKIPYSCIIRGSHGKPLLYIPITTEVVTSKSGLKIQRKMHVFVGVCPEIADWTALHGIHSPSLTPSLLAREVTCASIHQGHSISACPVGSSSSVVSNSRANFR